MLVNVKKQEMTGIRTNIDIRNGFTDEEDSGYPLEKEKKNVVKKLTIIQKSHIKKIINTYNTKNNNKKIKVSKKKVSSSPIMESDIEWGLGVEHEFVLVIDNVKTFNQLINILEKINRDKIPKTKYDELKQLYKQKKLFYTIPPPFISTLGLRYVNIEITSLNNIPMFDI